MVRKFCFFFAACCTALAAHAGAYEAMEEALIRGNAPAAIELIQRGMDVNTVDRRGNTLLMQAVRNDLPELFDFLLKSRARLNARNSNGETALALAAFFGRMNYVRQLADAGAEINYFGWPPLVYAAHNGHAAVADYLIERGADVDAPTESGATALFFAARFGHVEVAQLLLKHQASLEVVNDRGETAVDWAMKGRNTRIEDLLRAAGGRSGQTVTLELGK